VSKPVRLPSKALQDFFAYDFYTAKLYRLTVVFGVGLISRIISIVDHYLVDGLVNLVGLASIFGGESLKYSTSGQSQFYAFTILLGVGLLTIMLGWPFLSHLSLNTAF
jgi:NAD(P)H-quinone oxidoreductase subunit 5